MQQARDQLSYTRLVTDFDGVITTWHAEAGQVVSAGQAVSPWPGPKCARQSSTAHRGRESLPADARFLVRAQLDPQARTTGSIRELGPQADASTRTRRVRLSLAQTPEAFRLGSTIQVQLSSAGSVRSVLPASVLLERDGKTQVWVVDGKQSSVALREVQVLSRDERQVVIGQGLADGDRVVRAGVNSLKPARRSNSTRMRDEGRFQPVGLALRHQSLVWYLMAVSLVMGVFSYLNLGREEDPSFAIKTMVIQTRWPGATVDDTLEQVTDRIEKKLEELDSLDYVKSYTRPGESTVFVYLKDTTKAGDIPDIWYQVRKKISDIQGEFPQGIQGPGFNDEFGDVFGSVYAFTADGLDFRQLRDYVEKVRLDIRSVKDLGKVQMIGAQNEVIYLNFSTASWPPSVSTAPVVQSLQAQNAVTPSGVVEAGPSASRCAPQATSVRKRTCRRSTCGSTIVSTGCPTWPASAAISSTRRPRCSATRRAGHRPGGGDEGGRQYPRVRRGAQCAHAGDHRRTAVGVGVHQVSNQAQVVKKAVGGFTGRCSRRW
ncbi:efflux transporter, RND family, MFP subunit [Pseudomonas aeruginosa]|uniref:efflux RND transporter periplasmic adaptor subunit n=1 Tax=Pseudomonas aeruginosa TaxID=287 RepID=UPI000E061956|nr:efflux RND transporter periplasmic adaptor subunit [Pseudomonas aeruginosa]RCG93136.1 efflux transporter, RND family, MFP subunit [Pseudomonas aeruginosa]